jgi:hypothetical protein
VVDFKQIMRAITQHIYGTMMTSAEKTAVLLREPAPVAPATDSLYLRFAFIIRGPEEHVFPALALDDWGTEIRGLELYQWVRQYGEQFPRAELFGYDPDGSKTQFFLRELELYARLPCYVYQDAQAVVGAGRLVQSIALPTSQVTTPIRLPHPPAGIDRPLRGAHVSWWQVPSDTDHFDFSLLSVPPDPGF